MLIGQRRIALIHLCLAGMAAAWFTPLLALVSPMLAAPGLWVLYAGVLALLLLWMLLLQWLDRRVGKLEHLNLAALAAIVVSSAAMALAGLALVEPGAASGWARLVQGGRGLAPSIGLVALNLFAWQRAASATSRDLNFFGVSLSFRLGILLLLVTAMLAAGVRGLAVTSLIWLYFGLGLTAVSVARIEEKAAAARSAGSVLSGRRMAQLFLAVLLTVAIAASAAAGFTAGNIRAVVGWFEPLFRLIERILLFLLGVLFTLMSAPLNWLLERLRLADLSALQQALEGLSSAAAAVEAGEPVMIPAWVSAGLRVAGITLAVLLVLGLILLYLDRMRAAGRPGDPEQEAADEVTLGGNLLARGWRRLRNLGFLLRRYGLNRQLLAAVSVQNIYANVCRVARARGYPRHPAQPPDAYLPALMHAFHGEDVRLERITSAYMRVHYGEHPAAPGELAQLRADYQVLRQSGRPPREAAVRRRMKR